MKKGYEFNQNVSYEILSDLYIPEEDESLIGPNHNQNLDYLYDLQEQAYVQTNNQYKRRRWSSYTPAGNIQILDTRLQQNISLEGVRIGANRWFTTYLAITDANGNYSMNSTFKRPCDYFLLFQRHGFVVADNSWQASKICRNNIHGDWNHTITLGWENMQGHVFRGAYRYHYQNVAGLKRPFRSNWPSVIVAKNSTKDWSGINYIVFPVLKVARFRSANIEYDSDDYYSTTIHELAHTTHVITMNAGALQYSQVDALLQESWPTAVEWLLTGLEYKSRGIADYGDWNYPNSSSANTLSPLYPNDRAFQYWDNTISTDYTNLFINLIDSINESNINFGSASNPDFGSVDDQIQGYTLQDIESLILKHSYGLTSLSNELKSHKPAGVTDAQIDLLISHY